MHALKGSGGKDLDLAIGQLIGVTKQKEAGGWWTGVVLEGEGKGKEGKFPSTYTQQVKEEPASADQIADIAAVAPSLPASLPPSLRSEANEVGEGAQEEKEGMKEEKDEQEEEEEEEEEDEGEDDDEEDSMLDELGESVQERGKGEAREEERLDPELVQQATIKISTLLQGKHLNKGHGRKTHSNIYIYMNNKQISI